MKNLLLTLALATTAVAAPAQAPAATAAPATPSASATLGASATPSAPSTRSAAPLGPLVAAVLGTSDPAALTALAAQLAQVATQAPTDWLPRYYQAYALVTSSRRSPASAAAKDQLLDQAEAALGQARQLQGDASELLALQAYVYQARLVIDPQGRGQEYAPLVDEALAQAKAANPANPRPYLLAASQLYYTPAEYGGGPDGAQPLFEQARVKFAAFRPASALAPSWGQAQVQQMLGTYPAAGK